jgi:hypothetical protein
VSDQLEVLKSLAAQLDALAIPYMVTGSLASSHYSTPRFTRDIDLVVEMDSAGAGRLATALDGEFYLDADRLHHAATRSGMANIIHLQLLVKVDLIVRKDTAYRREEFDRRRSVVIDGVTIWFAAPEDLILSKLVWMRDSGSEIQRRDIEGLLRATRDVDRAYIERWTGELGVTDLWREVSGAVD